MLDARQSGVRRNSLRKADNLATIPYGLSLSTIHCGIRVVVVMVSDQQA